MADFRISGSRCDGAYCTVDTFRHLLSERQAIRHLQCVARALRRNSVYVLGLHLLPEQGFSDEIVRWSGQRGKLTVKTSMRMVDLNRRARRETLKVNLKINKNGKRYNYQSVYSLRTYTLNQFYRCLKQTNAFRIKEVYDHSYDTDSPIDLTAASEDVVFLLQKK